HQRNVSRADEAGKRASVASDAADEAQVSDRGAPHDPERTDEDVDIAEVVHEGPVVRQHDQRAVTLPVQPARDERELTVGPVAPRRGVEVEDGAWAQELERS